MCANVAGLVERDGKQYAAKYRGKVCAIVLAWHGCILPLVKLQLVLTYDYKQNGAEAGRAQIGQNIA